MTEINSNVPRITSPGEPPVRTGTSGGTQPVQTTVIMQSGVTSNVGDAFVMSQPQEEQEPVAEVDWTDLTSDDVINKVIQEGLESITSDGKALIEHPAVEAMIGDYCADSHARAEIDESIKAFRAGIQEAYDNGEITLDMKKEYEANLKALEKTLKDAYKEFNKTGHTPQPFALRAGTAPRIDAAQMNAVMETYAARLQNAQTSEERQEILDQLAVMINRGDISADAAARLIDTYSRPYRGDSGHGVIVTRKYGAVADDLKVFIGKLDPSKKHELIVAYLDAAPDNKDTCSQLFGRDAAPEIQRRRQAAIRNNESKEGRLKDDRNPKNGEIIGHSTHHTDRSCRTVLSRRT